MNTTSMKRLFVCDLDGVLVQNDGSIRDEDIVGIQKFIEKGGEFIICTGRLDQDIKYIEEKIGIKSKFRISQNGAVIKNNKDEVVFHKKINQQFISTINEILAKSEVRTEINNVDNRYFPSPRAPEDIAEFIDTSIIQEDLFNYTSENLEPTIYLNFGTFKEFEEIKQQMKENLGDQVNVTQTSATSLEIFSNEASKGKALKHVAEELGYKKEEIIVAGDAESDVTMFPYAGISFAVSEQAGESVIEKADHLVKTIEELITNYL